MNLEDFPGEEVELLVSLPYRVGRWMGDADDEEGSYDDEQESAALKEVIGLFARMEDGTPFTREVARRTLEKKKHWDQWDDKIFTVLADGKKALRIVEKKAGLVRAKNYRLMLLKIAACVARAADEFDDFNPEDDKASGLGGMVRKAVGRVMPGLQRESSHDTNISSSERTALDELAEALELEEG